MDATVIKKGTYEGDIKKLLDEYFQDAFVLIDSDKDSVNYVSTFKIKKKPVILQVGQTLNETKNNIQVVVSASTREQAKFLMNHLESVLHLSLIPAPEEEKYFNNPDSSKP